MTKPEPTKGIKPVPVPMKDSEMQVVRRYNRATKQYEEDTVNLGHGHLTFPFDFPTFMTLDRLMETVDGEVEKLHKGNGRMENSLRGLKGWTLTIDCFTFGVKLYVRIGRDGTLKVFAEDGDGVTKLEEWTK